MTLAMNTGRRALAALAGAAALAASLPAATAAPAHVSGGGRRKVGMLVYPGMILLDLVGPQTALSLLGADIHLVGRTRAPVKTDLGIPVTPTTTYAQCPAGLDVLFVPGGLAGTVALMGDDKALGFLRDRAPEVKYVTAVCTGSLVLGAAGLLRGYRATSHWCVRDLLEKLGATVAHDRVAIDRDRITAGGVTAGVDFGLVLAGMLGSAEEAKRIQLLMEYDPDPPFQAGSPEKAGPALVGGVRANHAATLDAASAAVEHARQRLGFG